MALLPSFIHHRPDRSNDASSIKDARYERTLVEYEKAFGSKPEASIWPPANPLPVAPSVAAAPKTFKIETKTISGQVLEFEVTSSMLTFNLKEMYSTREGIPVDQIRMIAKVTATRGS